MMKWSRNLIAGSALVLLANAVLLAGAAYNRSNEPESQLQLTQRELQSSQGMMRKDNSGITLTLNWRVAREAAAQENDYGRGYSAGKWGVPAWLDKAKMAELGFDVVKLTGTSESGRHSKKMQSREALLVLELNGQAWQQELKRAREYAGQSGVLSAGNPGSEEFKRRAKSAVENYQHEEQINSRLFVIDAGIDLLKLRTAYPDRQRYAIVHGLIQPSAVRNKNETRVSGYIGEVSAEHINVPLNYRQVFDSAVPYEVTVAFGKRLEPWITGASGSLPGK